MTKRPSFSESAGAPPAREATNRRRQGRVYLYLSFGLGAAALLSLIPLFVIGLSEEETAAADPVPEVGSSPEAKAAAAPEATLPAAAPVATTVAEAAPPPARSPSPSPAPPPAPVAPAPTIAMAKPAATFAPLPPCTETKRTGCRNVSKPGGTSAGAVAPNPFSTEKTGAKKGRMFGPSGI